MTEAATTEKDPFDEIAGGATSSEFDLGAALADFGDINLSASAEDFGAKVLQSAPWVDLEQWKWYPMTIVQAQLIKGNQDFNMGEPQILLQAEHLVTRFAACRRFSQSIYIPLAEQENKKGEKRRPGTNLFVQAGLMERPEDGGTSNLKITIDMVAAEKDHEDNDIIVIPALEGKEILAQVKKIKPGKEKEITVDGIPTGDFVTGRPREYFMDMIHATPDRVIEVIGKAETRKMLVDWESAADLVGAVHPGTVVSVRTLDEDGLIGEDIHRAIRTEGSKWQITSAQQIEQAKEERKEKALEGVWN